MIWSVALLPLLVAAILVSCGRHLGRAPLVLLASIGAIVTLALAGTASWQQWHATHAVMQGVSLSAAMPPPAGLFAVTAALVSAPVLAYAGYHEQRAPVRLLAMMMVLLGVTELVIIADDLLTLLIAWQLLSICAWALIVHGCEQTEDARHAGQTLLIVLGSDSALWIAAIIAITTLGTFDYASLAALEGTPRDTLIIALLGAAALRCAQWPFASWLFGASTATPPVSALLHTVTLLASGLYLLIRLQAVLSTAAWLPAVLIAIGLITALAGGVVASVQGHAGHLLAASSSVQFGLMWIAIGAGLPMLAALHFVAHALMKASLWLALGLAARRANTFTLDYLRLGQTMPRVAMASCMACLSLAGIVPLGAAWTTSAIITATTAFDPMVAALVIVASGLGALYALRFQLLVFDKEAWKPDERHDSRDEEHSVCSRVERGALYVLASLGMVFSLLWLPGIRTLLLGAAADTLPALDQWRLVAVLLVAALGIAVAAWLTRGSRDPVARSALCRGIANWFGLAAMAQWLIVSPFIVTARWLARFDNGLVALALHISTRLTHRLAAWRTRLGAALFQRLPDALMRLVGLEEDHQSHALQNGMTQHAMRLTAAGIVLVVIVAVTLLIVGVML